MIVLNTAASETRSRISNHRLRSIGQKLAKKRRLGKKERYAFMEKQFNLGKHPDTDTDFWEGYVSATSPPELPNEGGSNWNWWIQNRSFVLIMGIALMVLVPIYLISLMRRSSARRKKLTEAAG